MRLADYGKIVRSYSGTGTLIRPKGQRLRCKYDLVQYSDGTILLRCTQNSLGRKAGNYDAFERTRFSGSTLEGAKVSIKDMHCASFRVSNSSTEGIRIEASFHCAYVEINHKDTADRILANASLTNFEMRGDEPHEVASSEGTRSYRLRYRINLGDYPVTITPVDDYDDIVRSIDATEGIDVTCHVQWPYPSFVRTQVIEENLDILAWILSASRGNRINWINYDIQDCDADIVKTVLRDSVTGRKSTWTVIPHRTPSLTREFVESAYSLFRSAECKWNILPAISIFTDALSPGDSLEARGVKLSICLELVRSRYLLTRNSTYIMDQEEFASKAEELKSRFAELLQEVFPGLSRDSVTMMSNHAQGCNYFPFRRALKGICQQLELPHKTKDVNQIIEIRNSLVHEASFPGDPSARLRHFVAMKNFVASVILASLGYKGPVGRGDF